MSTSSVVSQMGFVSEFSFTTRFITVVFKLLSHKAFFQSQAIRAHTRTDAFGLSFHLKGVVTQICSGSTQLKMLKIQGLISANRHSDVTEDAGDRRPLT